MDKEKKYLFGTPVKEYLPLYKTAVIDESKPLTEEERKLLQERKRIEKASKKRAYIENTYEPIVHDPKNAIEVSGLKMYFPIQSSFLKFTLGYVKAVDNVSFTIKKGETMGLVGESGCGKTTVGRTILRLYPKLSGGEVLIDGKDIFAMSKKELQIHRPEFQIIFQDPFSSLSPRMPVGTIIGEAVREHKIVPESEYGAYLDKIMQECGLQKYYKDRYPHEFSGGQRQRICIARALALDPKFIVCDEPVSALDVSIQAQIINLLRDLQKERGLSYLFISHDLSVVEHISDTVGVMYLGSLVENAPTAELFKNPLHPYTQALFSAIPVPDPDYKMNRIILQGSLPSPANPPRGCKFHTRCQKAMPICSVDIPRKMAFPNEHYVNCHLYDEEAMERNKELIKEMKAQIKKVPQEIEDNQK